MGVRLAKLSPTRGFCAELSTALVRRSHSCRQSSFSALA